MNAKMNKSGDPSFSPENGQDSDKPRILVAICSCQQYAKKRQVIRDTWLSSSVRNIQACFFVGESGPLKGEPDTVVVAANDHYDFLPEKVRAFFVYALKSYDFDWIFKCDDDTYVALERLHELANPKYDIIGDKSLSRRGSPSGGAGYFLSRKIVERIVEDTSLSKRGSEDIIIGQAAVKHGAEAFATGRLSFSASPYPRQSNNIVTAHWCSAERLQAIHAVFHRNPDFQIEVKHDYWKDKLAFFNEGWFARTSADCNGFWSKCDTDTIYLRWFDWGRELLIIQDEQHGTITPNHARNPQ